MARSISMHGCSEMISHSSLPGSQDVKYEVTEDAPNSISRAVSRRDMATQMSPESSKHSSPGRDSSFSLAIPSILPIVESQSMQKDSTHQFSKPEMRDVLVDEDVTVIRWSKMNRGKNSGRGSRNADDWKRTAVNYHSASWEVSTATSKSISN
ncbi:uncharacterized protein LOC121757310 [Salvia splendens]|uniref:uncharacterized protein LOC121757310 n=1 Tax=Salvia splendens TaxID=180675 RepID=UPI001C256FBD|nr:uncharacterized protein LOC121757310 [Salvia splendens]XP_042008783.1 uncharacterized protein LOC121757310 [Salvia splendens]XP_042008784.1 uncharacterized protein LOC121757310 [Salvia splendens]XP_042008785.1 uncharacterized protein LOC121757310 [Salvia splendens]XP_042008786.1 uncharacterized protein LOC121757310 [Salvia splendens]